MGAREAPLPWIHEDPPKIHTDPPKIHAMPPQIHAVPPKIPVDPPKIHVHLPEIHGDRIPPRLHIPAHAISGFVHARRSR